MIYTSSDVVSNRMNLLNSDLKRFERKSNKIVSRLLDFKERIEIIANKFRRLMDSIDATRPFIHEEGSETHLRTLDILEEKAGRQFQNTSMSMIFSWMSPAHTGFTSIEVYHKEIVESVKTNSTRLFVFYNGKGTIYVRGNNAVVLSASRQKNELSWSRGISLVRMGNDLWTARMLPKTEGVAEYRFLINDSERCWSIEPTYQLQAQQTLHTPLFATDSFGLLSPIAIETGDSLCLTGEGIEPLSSQSPSPNITNEIQWSQICPNLWGVFGRVVNNGECKIGLHTHDSDLELESGETRQLHAGAVEQIIPCFASRSALALEPKLMSLSLTLLEKLDWKKKRDDEKQIAQFYIVKYGTQYFKESTSVKQKKYKEIFQHYRSLPFLMIFKCYTIVSKQSEKEPEKYVVRNSDLTSIYHSNQLLYGLKMELATMETQACLQECWGFENILRFISVKRFHIADPSPSTLRTLQLTGCNSANYSHVEFRIINMETTLHNCYSDVFPRVLKNISNEKYAQYYQCGRDPETCDHSNPIFQYAEIEGEKVMIAKFIRKKEKGQHTPFLIHTAPIDVARIVTYVEKILCPASMKIDKDNPRELTKALGGIFWWICVGKLWEGGDPSKAEILIKAIWREKLGKVPGWKNGIIPWMEVVCQPSVEEFMEQFEEFLDWEMN